MKEENTRAIMHEMASQLQATQFSILKLEDSGAKEKAMVAISRLIELYGELRAEETMRTSPKDKVTSVRVNKGIEKKIVEAGKTVQKLLDESVKEFIK